MAKGKGIYKRGNIWWIRYADPFGKIRFESSYSTSFREAQDILIQRKKEVMEGKAPIPKKRITNHSFRELTEISIKWIEPQGGYRQKASIINQLVEKFGGYPLRTFTTRGIEQLQSERLQFNKPATVNRLLATLKHMFTKAVEWEMVEDEVLKRIRKVKLLQENNRRLRYLSKEECKALVNASDPHLKPIIITALNTGMRKEEILSLEWDKHIDLKHGFILLNKTKNGDRREIPINQTLRETLQGLVKHINSPYVFTDSEGKRYQDVKRSFNSALKRAVIKDFRFHDLRHTFASHLVMTGIDLTTVSRLLGHKNLTMTLRYSHLAPEHMVRAVDLLDNTLNGKSTIQKLYNQGVVSNA